MTKSQQQIEREILQKNAQDGIDWDAINIARQSQTLLQIDKWRARRDSAVLDTCDVCGGEFKHKKLEEIDGVKYCKKCNNRRWARDKS